MITRILAVAVAAGLLTGCVRQTEQQRIAEKACRAQADEVASRTNRADMAQRDTSTTPFAAQGLPGINTQPLAERSVYDQNLLNCVNATGDLPETSK